MTAEFRFNNRWVIAVGYAALASLLILSLIFYRERCCYTDMAFHVFCLAKTRFPAIQNYRFGVVLTQIFPLTAILLKVPLREVLIIYSLAFYILYLVIFITVVHYFKNEYLGMCLVFFLTITCSYTFYWAQSEFPQANGLLVLLLAIPLRYPGSTMPGWIKFLFLPVLLVTVLFLHPLVIYPLGFSVAYLYLDKKLRLGFAVQVLIVVIICALLKQFVFVSGYDSYKMGGLTNFISLFPNYFTTPSWKFFFSKLLTDYLVFSVLFVVIVSYYIVKGFYGKLLFFILATTGYIFLIHVSFYYVARDNYMQNMLLPLGLMVGLPFFFEIAPKMPAVALTFLLAITMVFRLSMIYREHKAFSERLTYVTSLLNYTRQYACNRFYIPEEHLSREKLGPIWGLSYETLLLSGMISPDSVRTIETEEVIKRRPLLLNSDNVFINCMWGWDMVGMDYYFRFRKCKYQLLDADLRNL